MLRIVPMTRARRESLSARDGESMLDERLPDCMRREEMIAVALEAELHAPRLECRRRGRCSMTSPSNSPARGRQRLRFPARDHRRRRAAGRGFRTSAGRTTAVAPANASIRSSPSCRRTVRLLARKSPRVLPLPLPARAGDRRLQAARCRSRTFFGVARTHGHLVAVHRAGTVFTDGLLQARNSDQLTDERDAA